MRPTVLETRNLTVGYGACAILKDLELSLEAGELVVLLGANGAGKSTLLRSLAGLQRPLAGKIELLGEDLQGLSRPERARRVGVVLPERSSVGLLTVFELVALGRHPFTDWTGRLRRFDVERVCWALEQAGLEGFASRRVGQLSDGERQKVMIARALAQEPKVLILDEPTAFLDLPGRVDILALLRQLAHDGKSEQRAVLLSTHDLDLALRTADRVWLVHDGTVRVGAPEDLAINGALEAAFSGRFVTFDDEQGTFRLKVEPGTDVALIGTGRATLWTRRALRRAGFGVRREECIALRVEVIESASKPAWRVSTPRGESTVHSLAALLRLLEEDASG